MQIVSHLYHIIPMAVIVGFGLISLAAGGGAFDNWKSPSRRKPFTIGGWRWFKPDKRNLRLDN